MKKTKVVVLLDRSGSMEERKADHVGGLRSFVSDQKSEPGDVSMTLIQFDSHDPCEIKLDDTPIQDVDTSKIELVPRGGTPLLDAIMRATAHVEQKVASEDNVMFMIITDGEENSSREANKTIVKNRLTALEAKGWVVMYLGANVDAFHEAGQIGISMRGTAGYSNNAAAIGAMYDDIKGKAWKARTSAVRGQSLSASDFEYSDQDREQLMTGKIVSSNAAVGKAEFQQAANTEEKK